MSFKPKSVNTNTNAVTIDYEKIAEQIEEGNNPARISLIVDLGIHERGQGLRTEKGSLTVFESEDEAGEWYARVVEIVGDKEAEKYRPYSQPDTGTIQADAELYQKKPAQELAIFADLVDTRVEYVEGQGEKQYRVILNKTFRGEIAGLPFQASPPKTKGSTLWTFASNGMLYKLANVTGHPEIVDGKDESKNMDISLILGEPLYVDLRKSGSFVNMQGISAPRKSETINPLDNEPVLVTFDGATFDVLNKAKLNARVLKKIKEANNYEGSAMQAAVLAYETSRSDSGSEVETVTASVDDEPF